MSTPVGSLATEAALLLDAIAGRLESFRPGADPDAAGAGEIAGRELCPQCGHDPSAAATCTACPLCRLIAVLRGERPETTARLVDGALTVVRALRALVPGPEGTAGGPAGDPSTGDPATGNAADEAVVGGADADADAVDTGAESSSGPAPEDAQPPASPRSAGRPAAGIERIIVR